MAAARAWFYTTDGSSVRALSADHLVHGFPPRQTPDDASAWPSDARDQRAQREGARGAAFERRGVTVTTSPSTELGRGRRAPRRNHPRPDRCYGMIFSTSPTVGAVLKLAT